MSFVDGDTDLASAFYPWLTSRECRNPLNSFRNRAERVRPLRIRLINERAGEVGEL